MIIRATEDDIPRLVEMGKQSAACTNPGEEYAPERVEGFLRGFIPSDLGCVFIYEYGGVAVGWIAAGKYPNWYTTGDIVLVLSIWVDPKFRGGRVSTELLGELETWAKSKGAQYISAFLPSIGRAKWLYLNNGYCISEYGFKKEV